MNRLGVQQHAPRKGQGLHYPTVAIHDSVFSKLAKPESRPGAATTAGFDQIGKSYSRYMTRHNKGTAYIQTNEIGY
jgi:hypothetical protein